MRASLYRRARWLVAIATVVACFTSGCGSRDAIHSYVVPKERPAAVAATPADEGEPTDRMLVAIAPAGEQAYFLKVAGPATVIDAQAEEIMTFFRSVRVGPGHPTPDWKPKENWTVEAGSGMRAATIRIPTDKEPLEMSVTMLPWRGTPEDLLSNVNRWRGQMKLPAARGEQLGEFTSEVQAGDAAMTVVDLRGRYDAGTMTPPFAGATGGANQAGAEGNLPAGHPPIGTAGGQSAASGAPNLEAPAEWRALAAGGMRKAAFEMGEAGRSAIVTVIDFPADAGPMIADPLENVNRWRREVGMGEIDKAALEKTVESVEVDGQPGTYVRLIPDTAKAEESQIERATLAALVTSGRRIWFFKLTGDRATVANEEDHFKQFLKSVRFAPDGGAGDGNG
jgi:hypothetical protein